LDPVRGGQATGIRVLLGSRLDIIQFAQSLQAVIHHYLQFREVHGRIADAEDQSPGAVVPAPRHDTCRPLN